MNLGRKSTGGKYIKSRKKKLYEKPGQKISAKLSDEEKRKTERVMGGNKKVRLLRGKTINIQKDKKSEKAEIKNVTETPSNRFLARQNILTKGTIVETDKGKVKITNRPTKEGFINGVVQEQSE